MPRIRVYSAIVDYWWLGVDGVVVSASDLVARSIPGHALPGK